MTDGEDPRLKYSDRYNETITLLELLEKWNANKKLINDLCYGKQITPYMNGRTCEVKIIDKLRFLTFPKTLLPRDTFVIEDTQDVPKFEFLPDEVYFKAHNIKQYEQSNPEILNKREPKADNDFTTTPLDAIDKEAQEIQCNKKGWPTITLENFVERVLVPHVGEENAIPVFLSLLEVYELVLRDGVIDAKPINRTNLIKRIKQKDNDVMSDLWEVLLIKERHYSIHRSDVAEAYKRASKLEFPWLQLDEKYSCLPCIDFVETNSNGNDASKLPGLPATESDFKEALNQDSWTAREAIFWLQGRNPEWCRGDIENYFK